MGVTNLPPPPPGGLTPPLPSAPVPPVFRAPAGSPIPPPPESPGGVAQRDDAGFWARLGGELLDQILYGLLLMPFVIACFALLFIGLDNCANDPVTGRLECEGSADTGLMVGGVVVLIVGFVLVAIVYLRALARTGQTWGRRIVGIKVIRSDTAGPPGWGRAIGRSLFASIISRGLFYLGYLWMLWDSEHQTWHDKVAGTYVVVA